MTLRMLKERSRIVRTVREFFDSRGFTEVETAVWIEAPAPEEHIDCPQVAKGGFLRASPELQMKKMLAVGMEKICQIGPCFREGEKGRIHNPEFTMIEWYRKNATYLDIRRDMEELLASTLPSTPTPSTYTLKVRDAYTRFAGWDPFAEFDQDRFDFDMATKIEPAIKAIGGGVFLTDYPRQAASLARVVGEGEDAYAERWEFYWDGVELANCFTELCDGAEQRRRFERAKEKRRELGEADYPLDEEFLSIVDRMESAAGVALGVDRLVMVATGAKSIGEVRW